MHAHTHILMYACKCMHTHMLNMIMDAPMLAICNFLTCFLACIHMCVLGSIIIIIYIGLVLVLDMGNNQLKIKRKEVEPTSFFQKV